MQVGSIHSDFVHLVNEIVGGISGDLPVMSAWLAVSPDMQLFVDDFHELFFA